jgi:serine O-acetyltransferase
MKTYNDLVLALRVEVGHGADKPLPFFSTLKKLRAKERAHFLFWFRVAQYFYRKPKGIISYKRLAKNINNRLLRTHNIDIGLGADIALGLHFAHKVGIVITDRCIIGKNLTIRQNTTIGIKDATQPGIVVIGDNVDLGAHCCIIGNNIRIGNNAVIGAMSFVNKDVPNNTIFFTTHTPNYRTS